MDPVAVPLKFIIIMSAAERCALDQETIEMLGASTKQRRLAR